MAIERKQFLPEIKAVDEGKATIVVATLNTVDKHNDVTLPGFFGTQVVQAVGSHNWDSVPIAKAKIYEVGEDVLVDLLFNDTSAGQDWYRSIKFDFATPPAKQEYSYGFQIRDGGSEHGMFQGKPVRFLKALEDGTPGADVVEVSPVLRGAGERTRTLVIKEDPLLAESVDLIALKQEGFTIQTLIFPKTKWASADAVRAWCREHDFASGIDETESSYRVRQKDPGDFERLRTICLMPRDAAPEECRVQAAGGSLKEGRSVDPSTTAVKRLISVHHTDTSDRLWDPEMQQRYVKSSAAGGYYRQIYALQDAGDDTRKDHYRFIHHFVSEDGLPGPASIRACLQQIAILNKGVIRESERAGLYAHLFAHLKDAGREAPELRSSDMLRYPMDAQVELTLWDLEYLIYQMDHIRDLRARKGMTLTAARIEQMRRIDEKLELFKTLVRLKDLDKPPDELSEEMKLAARAERLTQRITDMRQQQRQAAEAQQQSAITDRLQRFQTLQQKIHRN